MKTSKEGMKAGKMTTLLQKDGTKERHKDYPTSGPLYILYY